MRTDYYSLKFLLEQRVISSPLQKWLIKLIGYDFSIKSQPRKQNIVANALSYQHQDVELLLAVTMPQLMSFDLVREEIQGST